MGIIEGRTIDSHLGVRHLSDSLKVIGGTSGDLADHDLRGPRRHGWIKKQVRMQVHNHRAKEMLKAKKSVRTCTIRELCRGDQTCVQRDIQAKGRYTGKKHEQRRHTGKYNTCSAALPPSSIDKRIMQR